MAFWTRLFTRTRKEQELQEEIDVHLSMEMHQRIERGESREDAFANARKDFGNAFGNRVAASVHHSGKTSHRAMARLRRLDIRVARIF
jgi:hypothetical protein